MNGTFRLVIDGVYRDYPPESSPGEKLPLKQRVSNTFQLRVRG